MLMSSARAAVGSTLIPVGFALLAAAAPVRADHHQATAQAGGGAAVPAASAADGRRPCDCACNRGPADPYAYDELPRGLHHHHDAQGLIFWHVHPGMSGPPMQPAPHDEHANEHEHHHGDDGHADEHEHHHGADGHANEHEHHHADDGHSSEHEHHHGPR